MLGTYMENAQFEIADEFLCSITETKDIVFYISADQIPVEFAGVLKPGKNVSKATSSIDHPEFTNLRNKLENLGYIAVQRAWWNGDRVLKPFTLNGFAFEEGETFACASALSIKFKVAKERKNIS
jgi:hypothetical protein